MRRPWFLAVLLPLAVGYSGCTLDEFLFLTGCSGCEDNSYNVPGAPAPEPNGANGGSSDVESGPGALVTPGIDLPGGTSALHALVGYSRLGFDGGRDDVYHVGAQYRRFLVSRGETYHPWVGGEVAYVRMTTVPDVDGFFGPDNPHANGFSIGAVGAYPLSQKIPLTAVARAGVIDLGSFRASDAMFSSGQTTPYVRVGLDLDLQSMIAKKK